MSKISYRNLHFPSSIIQRAVWLYSRFNLSLRDDEALMAERGAEVSYGSVRRWMKRFGPPIARGLRRGRPRAPPQYQLDEMYVSIGGRWMYLWRTIVTEKWRAYAAAFRDLGFKASHRQAKWKNNRIEGSHVRVHRRERTMQGFRSPGSAHRFLSVHAAVCNHFTTRRHLISAAEHRHRHDQAFTAWRIAASVVA
jgi:putative transposase